MPLSHHSGGFKMKMLVNKVWYNKLVECSLEWNHGAREKFVSFILCLLKEQREGDADGHNLKGVKNAKGLDVVEVSDKKVANTFSKPLSRIKARRLIFANGLAIKDGSWVSTKLADRLNDSPRNGCWHITEADKEYRGERVEVEFTDKYGCFFHFGEYKAAVRAAEGKYVNATDVFHGMWVLDAYERGEVTWFDFASVARSAQKVLEPPTESKDCRIYDAVALMNHDLRGKCFVNAETGQGMQELFDIPAAITIDAKIAAIALGIVTGDDNILQTWADQLLRDGVPLDPYKKMFDGIWEWDKKATVFREWDADKRVFKERCWTPAVRKDFKVSFQVVDNNTASYLKECCAVYYGKKRVKRPDKRMCMKRTWAIYKGLERTDKVLFDIVNICSVTGFKDAFYRLHTLGEKMIMDTMIEVFTNAGHTVHRVHDALWTTDKALIDAGPEKITRNVGRIIGAKLANLKKGASKEKWDLCKQGKYASARAADDPQVGTKLFLTTTVDTPFIAWASEPFITQG